MKAGLLLVALQLAAIRVWIGCNITPPSGFDAVDGFKDVAHVYMGLLLHAAYTDHFKFTLEPWRWAPTPLWKLFWAMNALEVATAVLSRV